MTTSKARARYVEGKLELLDPLPLREDAEVLVTLEDEPPLDDEEMRRLMGQAAGGWKEFFDEDPSLADDLYRQCTCCPPMRSGA
ncbi:MAG: hypothetical protein OXC31_14400 [Spirochaetaceae bacterium]|nr:hypothetical protein [Spirochaetaceae bacterium]